MNSLAQVQELAANGEIVITSAVVWMRKWKNLQRTKIERRLIEKLVALGLVGNDPVEGFERLVILSAGEDILPRGTPLPHLVLGIELGESPRTGVEVRVVGWQQISELEALIDRNLVSVPKNRDCSA